MGGDAQAPAGPDLRAGVDANSIADGQSLVGHFDADAVLMVRRGDEFFAIGANCSHYGGPLGDGLVVEDTVRCPWHHACFSLRTGEALRTPALNAVACYDVVRRGATVHVTGKRSDPGTVRPRARRDASPSSVAIVGAGAAGNSCAEELRKLGFEGAIAMVDPDAGAPYDRPNLSKDYLAGNAPEEWIPLHPPEHYEEKRIELLRQRVARLEPTAKKLGFENGTSREFGASCSRPAPSRRDPELPGSGPPVHTLRSLQDSRDIIAAATAASRPSSSAPASSASRSRPRCEPASSACMSSHRAAGRLKKFSDRSSVTSSAPCTNRMAWCSISERRRRGSNPGMSCWKMERGWQRISSSRASACGRGSSWRNRPACASTTASS
jgi:nitrite reductase/ring-hydroxylating ferredoxin subunit